MGVAIKIPKIIHHTWIGNDPLPPEAVDNIDTWKRHHPEWRFRLWTLDNVPPLHNQALYDAHSNTGHRADILRYELLQSLPQVLAAPEAPSSSRQLLPQLDQAAPLAAPVPPLIY